MIKSLVKFLFYLLVMDLMLHAQSEVDGSNFIHIKEIVFENVTDDEEKGDLHNLTLQYTNSDLSFDDLKLIRKKIKDYYNDKGMLFVKVILPKQDISDGNLKYVVIKGKIENITVLGNEFYTKEFIKSNFHLKEGSYLDYNKIVESVILLNEFSDLQVKSYFKKGSTLSTTDIELHVEDDRVFHGNILYDNLGSEDIAKDRVSVNLSYGNLLMQGDMITLSSTIGSSEANTKLYGGDYSVMVGNYHTKVHIGYLYANYIAGADFSVLEMEGTTNILTAGITQPVMRSITNKVDISLDYSYKEVKNYLLGDISSEDKLKAIIPSLYWQYMDIFSAFSSHLLIAKGINNDVLQGSRVNQEVDFLKANLNLSYNRKITDNNEVQLLLNTQFSGDKLPVIEMFSIGGLSSVRGFRPSEKLGDSGFTSSVEWFYTLDIKPDWFDNSFKLGLFLDYGKAYVNDAVAGESEDATLVGSGVEMMATVDEHYFARIVVGSPLSSENTLYEEETQVYFIVGAKF